MVLTAELDEAVVENCCLHIYELNRTMINLIFHSNCSLVGCRSMAGCTVAVFIITGRATGSIV